MLGQNVYELIRPLENKKRREQTRQPAKILLNWTASSPLPVSEMRWSGAACHVTTEVETKLAEVA